MTGKSSCFLYCFLVSISYKNAFGHPAGAFFISLPPLRRVLDTSNARVCIYKIRLKTAPSGRVTIVSQMSGITSHSIPITSHVIAITSHSIPITSQVISVALHVISVSAIRVRAYMIAKRKMNPPIPPIPHQRVMRDRRDRRVVLVISISYMRAREAWASH